MPKHSDPLDACFQALSDSTRRAVIARLAGGPLSASTLAEPFGMAMPSFLQHLSVLALQRLRLGGEAIQLLLERAGHDSFGATS